MADARSIFYRTATLVNIPTIASASTAMGQNLNRTGFLIVNLGTNPLYVLFGSGASTTVFHVPLKAATVADDGTGGSVSMENGIVWTGIITVAGTSPRYTVTEFS